MTIVLNNSYHNSLGEPWSLELMGLGLVSISQKSTKVLFSKGINDSMLNVLIRAYKDRILQKREGKIVELIGSYTAYAHFYDLKNEIFTLFYLNENKFIKYDELCSFSNKVVQNYCTNYSQSNFNSMCNDIVSSLPGLSALFIISDDGHALFSKTSKKHESFKKNAIQISGFISAIMMFSDEVIGKQSGEHLKAIDFENIQFLVTMRNKIIFAYLIENQSKAKEINRFIGIIAEEFITRFSDHLKDFKGNISIFKEFDSYINRYFDI
jgi:hypothetical protein